MRRKRIRHARLAHLFSGGLCRHAQFLGAQCLEVAGVKANQVVLALIQPQHLRGNRLQRPQQFPIVLGHQRHIRSAQFNIDNARLQPLRVPCAVPRGDAVFQAKPAQLVEVGEKSRYFLGSLLQIFDGHDKPVSQSRAGWDIDLAVCSQKE